MVLLTMRHDHYKKLLIYYWSGTGNSYRVATWIGTFAEKNGVDTGVFSIDENKPGNDIPGDNNRLMGLVFPTHGFTAPWHIMKLVGRLPRGNSSDH